MKEFNINSKYFHLVANFKKRKKLSLELKIGRRSTKDSRRIKLEVRRFFRDLYHQDLKPFIKMQEALV